jgi:ribosomal protein S18 acetylase RimI-like enzyme
MSGFAVRPARSGDAEDVIEAWRLSFGDEESFIHRMLIGLGLLRTAIVAEDETGRVRSAMLAFDGLLLGGVETTYLYALCTHPDFRSRGMGGAVVSECVRAAEERGAQLVCLHPASEELAAWYERRLGMQTLSKSGALSLEPEPMQGAEVIRVGAEEYSMARGGYRDTLPLSLLRAQELVAADSGASLMLFRRGSREYPMSAEFDGRELVIRELLCPKERLEQTAAAAGALMSAEKVRLVLPNENGERCLMGVYTGRERAMRPPYLPFTLD